MKNKTKTIFISIITLIACLSIANIVASNAVAITGNKLLELDQKAIELKIQNQYLQKQTSQKSSLSIIASRALEMGLVAIDQTAYISTPKPLAKAPSL